MAKKITLEPAVADVLSRATIDGTSLVLPGEQLDRPTYEAVNKALMALGGKWNRKARAHVFAEPIADRLAEMLDAGHVTVDKMGYFPTPAPLVARLLELADIQPHHLVLEPSAGQGAIADALAELVQPHRLRLVEIQPQNCRALRGKGYQPIEGDFLVADLPTDFDRVVMNPPFERKQDMDHVTRALELLKPGGRLVSVMARGGLRHADRKAAAFAELLEAHGAHVEANPDGSFKESGTGVHSITVVIDKAETGQLRMAA